MIHHLRNFLNHLAGILVAIPFIHIQHKYTEIKFMGNENVCFDKTIPVFLDDTQMSKGNF